MLLSVSRTVVLCLFVALICVANPRFGKRVSFKDHWRFQPGDVRNGQNTDFNDSQWRQLNLPHDWSIEGEFSEKAPAGYRRRSIARWSWLVSQDVHYAVGGERQVKSADSKWLIVASRAFQRFD